MAEPINLDDLLSKDEPIVETPEETSETPEETSSADDSAEDQGTDDSSEDNESQNVETSVENTEEADSEAGYASETVVQEDDTIQTNDTADVAADEAPAQYKFKDPFIEKAVQYYETYGTLQPFLRATEVDYNEMSDLELLKIKFDSENSDLSPKARQKLFDKEVERYGLDSYDEEDKEVGEALLTSSNRSFARRTCCSTRIEQKNY